MRFFVSYTGHSLGKSYTSAVMQLVFSTAKPAGLHQYICIHMECNLESFKVSMGVRYEFHQSSPVYFPTKHNDKIF